MSDVTLYGFPVSTFVRTARMAMIEKGVSYTLVEAAPGSEELAGLHPFNKIPVMQHGDVRIFETLGIATYVDGVFDGPKLVPADPVAKARMFQWISAHNDSIMKPFITIAFQRMIRPMLMQEKGDEAIAMAAMPRMGHAVDVLNEALTHSEYLVETELTLADLFVLPVVQYLVPAGCAELLEGRDALNAWAGRMGDRDSVVDTRPQAAGDAD